MRLMMCSAFRDLKEVENTRTLNPGVIAQTLSPAALTIAALSK